MLFLQLFSRSTLTETEIEMNMKNAIYLTALTIFNAGFVSVALAESTPFDGLCFPGDGCTGAVKIENGSFITCEQNCEMANPVHVRGVDAIIYDVKCIGDHASGSSRMIFSFVELDNNSKEAHVISSDSITKLVSCN